MTYTDNDIEDLDEEEYNYAYYLWLQEEGWEVVEDDGKEQVPFLCPPPHRTTTLISPLPPHTTKA